MSDNDDALTATAVGLNEDAKAARKKRDKSTGGPLDAAKAHLSGERAAEPEESLAEVLSGLGETVDRVNGGTEGYDISEVAHTMAIDRMEGMATDAVLQDRSLVFDVRDFLLDQIKSRPKPWSGTSNAEQRDVAAACEHAAVELVRKIVEAVATNGQDPVRVLLTKVTLGDDIVISGKVKTFAEDEEDRAVTMLHGARGKHVMLTVASVDDYRGEQREAETLPDQNGFGFEAGSDDHPDDDSDLAGDDEA